MLDAFTLRHQMGVHHFPKIFEITISHSVYTSFSSHIFFKKIALECNLSLFTHRHIVTYQHVFFHQKVLIKPLMMPNLVLWCKVFVSFPSTKHLKIFSLWIARQKSSSLFMLCFCSCVSSTFFFFLACGEKQPLQEKKKSC